MPGRVAGKVALWQLLILTGKAGMVKEFSRLAVVSLLDMA